MRLVICFAAILLSVFAQPAKAGITVQAWGGVRGDGVDLFTLTNAKGMEARITNYGAVITAVRMPGRDGKLTNVVQGFDSLAEYTSPDYKGRYGAIIGRFANRIMDNTFRINNATYRISRDAYVLNDDKNNRPYDERVWTANTKDGDEPQLILSLIDRNGSMGFPGTLRVQVTYTLTRNNVLRMEYRASSDKDTIVNLTNHAYFNMAGDGSVLDQLLTVNADAITVGDDKNVPTGAMRKVEGTAFDFRTPTPIGKNINHPDPAIQLAKGFDQNYALNGKPGTLRLAARLEDPKSGRVLEEWTTQPGLQVYSANYAPPTAAAAKGYGIHSAVALEAQGFPNAPNVPSFPSTFLKKGDTYSETTEYRFIVKP
jgi:aldose 1-epimerase